MSRPVNESIEEEAARIRREEAQRQVLRQQERDTERVRRKAERDWLNTRDIQRLMRQG